MRPRAALSNSSGGPRFIGQGGKVAIFAQAGNGQQGGAEFDFMGSDPLCFLFLGDIAASLISEILRSHGGLLPASARL